MSRIPPPGGPRPAHPLEVATLQRYRRCLAEGRSLAAEDCLREALVQEPNLPGVHVALAQRRWPGPDYRFWLAWFHAHLTPRVYLEIGVERGESLALANAATRSIGVDPHPIGDPLQGCKGPARLYRQTSAAFFAAVPADSELEPAGFDLAFIDGDHRFEAVLDDFISAERHAAPGAVLLLHDTLPLSVLTASPERRTGFYSGDGWKIVPCLRALRPDLRIVTVPAAPTGLSIVTRLDPSSTVLQSRLPLIRQAYAALPADHIVAAPDQVLALGLNEPAWMAHWLQSAREQ